MKFRMYHLTMYNISEIQKGIQCYHAGIEYALKYWEDDDFQCWAKTDKTVILLNGGTSTSERQFESGGSMEKYLDILTNELKWKNSFFLEPDLNYSLSGIAFLVSEQVYDKELYPEFEIKTNEFSYKGDNFIEYVPDWFKRSPQYNQVISKYTQWVESIGGEQNRLMRIFLKQFRMA